MMPFQSGDPNGTRTRVFAVDCQSRLKSTAFPQFPALFQPLHFNGLRGSWQTRGEHRFTSAQEAAHSVLRVFA